MGNPNQESDNLFRNFTKKLSQLNILEFLPGMGRTVLKIDKLQNNNEIRIIWEVDSNGYRK